MEFSHVDTTGPAQLKLLKDRVQQLQMQNMKLEHLLKTNSPNKASAGSSFLPSDQFDLLSSCWSQADEKLPSQFGDQLNQQIPITLPGANISPACNTYFTGGQPPQQHQGQLVQAGSLAARLGDATAFIQNNQNTLVQNNTNLIQPINLVNIGSLTEDTPDGNAATSAGGFILMRDGRLSYLPHAVVTRQEPAPGLPGIECMLGQQATVMAPTKRSDRHLQSQQSRRSTKKRPRPLKPKPIAPAVGPTSRPYILPKQQKTQPCRKPSRAKRKARTSRQPVEEVIERLPTVSYCPVQQLEAAVPEAPQPIIQPTAYFNCLVSRVKRPKRLEDRKALVNIHLEENSFVNGHQRVPSSGRVASLLAAFRPKDTSSKEPTGDRQVSKHPGSASTGGRTRQNSFF